MVELNLRAIFNWLREKDDGFLSGMLILIGFAFFGWAVFHGLLFILSFTGTD